MFKTPKGDSVTQDPPHTRARAHEGGHHAERSVKSARPCAASVTESPNDSSPRNCSVIAGDSEVTHGDSANPESPDYEAEIQRRIVNSLIRAGFWPEPLVQGAGTPPRRKRLVWYGKTKGAPDIDVIGENVHLEVKRPKERPEPHQRAYHARARRFGAVVATVTSESEALAVMDGVRELRALLRWMDRWLT